MECKGISSIGIDYKTKRINRYIVECKGIYSCSIVTNCFLELIDTLWNVKRDEETGELMPAKN